MSAMLAAVRAPLLRLALGLLVACGVLAAVEGGLRLAFGPPPPPRFVAAVWRPDVPPLRVAGERVFPDFQEAYAAPPFPVLPFPGTARVMVFGESSVRGGSRLPPDLEIPARLEADLRGLGVPAEVINLGRPALDSGGIRWIGEQALDLGPSVVVVYAGHNDIGNAYMSSRYGDPGSTLVVRGRILLEGLRLHDLMVRLLRPGAGGLSHHAPSRDGPRPLPASARLWAEADFGRNLAHLVRACRARGVGVVLGTPASRLGTWSATTPICPDALPPGTWRASPSGPVLEGRAADAAAIEAALRRVPDCPEALFLRGRLRVQTGEFDAGIADLRRARDLDPEPVRATRGIVAAIHEVGAEEGGTVVDVDAAFAALPNSDALFIDPLHPSAEGHRRIAALLAPAVARELAARPPSLGTPRPAAPPR